MKTIKNSQSMQKRISYKTAITDFSNFANFGNFEIFTFFISFQKIPPNFKIFKKTNMCTKRDSKNLCTKFQVIPFINAIFIALGRKTTKQCFVTRKFELHARMCSNGRRFGRQPEVGPLTESRKVVPPLVPNFTEPNRTGPPNTDAFSISSVGFRHDASMRMHGRIVVERNTSHEKHVHMGAEVKQRIILGRSM